MAHNHSDRSSQTTPPLSAPASLRLRPAQPSDWPQIKQLLLACQLPIDGAEQHLLQFCVAEQQQQIEGVAGYERYGNTALLRSVATSARIRGQGIGKRLVAATIERAQTAGVHQLFLLTTTAESFFLHQCFAPCQRQSVPAEIQQSIEFKHACPASAIAMQRRLI